MIAIIWLFVCLSIDLVTTFSHFRGGSTSYEYISTFVDNGSTHYRVKVTLLTGWDLALSPCGDGCTVTDVGKSTTSVRKDIIKKTNSQTIFGEWWIEYELWTGSIGTMNITTIVNPKLEGKVVYVSSRAPYWMQEQAHFTLELPECRYADIIFKGSSWLDLDMQNCSSYNGCDFYLQQKIKFGDRDDIEKPNDSPKMLYQSINKIKPNEVAKIPVTVTDSNGDGFVCKKATYKLAPFPQIASMEVDNNCTVSVNSTGYPVGSWGVVNIIVQDLPLSELTMGGMKYLPGGQYYLSQMQVQFLVQVSDDKEPKFVEPTACLGMVGWETESPVLHYSYGAALSIPLYAVPHAQAPNDTIITDFKVTVMPNPSTPLIPIAVPTKSPSGVWESILQWTIEAPVLNGKNNDEVVFNETYLLQVIARDSQGLDSSACSFRVEFQEGAGVCRCQNDGQCDNVGRVASYQPVSGEELCLCPLGFIGDDCSTGETDPRPKNPTFDSDVGVPNGGTLVCYEKTPCTFAVHTIVRDSGVIPELESGPMPLDVSLDLLPTFPETSTSMPGYRYVTPVTVSAEQVGSTEFCLFAKSTKEYMPPTSAYCYHLEVLSLSNKPPDTGTTSFVSPTPPGGTEIPCHEEYGCYLLMYTHVLTTGKCPKVLSETPETGLVMTITEQPDPSAGLCVAQILMFTSDKPVCLTIDPKSFDGDVTTEIRCYTVTKVDFTAEYVCRGMRCNFPLGACLATAKNETRKCVCPGNMAFFMDGHCEFITDDSDDYDDETTSPTAPSYTSQISTSAPAMSLTTPAFTRITPRINMETTTKRNEMDYHSVYTTDRLPVSGGGGESSDTSPVMATKDNAGTTIDPTTRNGLTDGVKGKHLSALSTSLAPFNTGLVTNGITLASSSTAAERYSSSYTISENNIFSTTTSGKNTESFVSKGTDLGVYDLSSVPPIDLSNMASNTQSRTMMHSSATTPSNPTTPVKLSFPPTTTTKTAFPSNPTAKTISIASTTAKIAFSPTTTTPPPPPPTTSFSQTTPTKNSNGFTTIEKTAFVPAFTIKTSFVPIVISKNTLPSFTTTTIPSNAKSSILTTTTPTTAKVANAAAETTTVKLPTTPEAYTTSLLTGNDLNNYAVHSTSENKAGSGITSTEATTRTNTAGSNRYGGGLVAITTTVLTPTIGVSGDDDGDACGSNCGTSTNKIDFDKLSTDSTTVVPGRGGSSPSGVSKENDSKDPNKGEITVSPGHWTGNDEKCRDAFAWEKAILERKATCTCLHPDTGARVTVIRERVSTKRLFRAFYIGLGVGCGALFLAACIFCLAPEKSHVRQWTY